MRKLGSLVVLALLLSLTTALVTAQSLWVPYIPSSGAVELVYWKQGGIAYMTVSITVGSLNGYNISNWGTPTITGNNISVNIEMWRYLGITVPVITVKYHTYNLSRLQLGEYLFIFKAWGTHIKNTTFTVPAITVPDDYSTIQQAINNAQDGDTVFVRNGTYHENVVVNKSISLIGEDRDNTKVEGNGTGRGFDLYWMAGGVGLEGVTIANLTVSNFEYGFYLGQPGSTYPTGNNTLVQIAVIDCMRGISMGRSNSNLIQKNLILNCSVCGILVGQSANNVIFSNTVGGVASGSGVYLTEGESNIVAENTIVNCHTAIGASGYSTGNLVKSNRIKGIYGIAFYSSFANTIVCNYIENCFQAVRMSSCTDNLYFHNNFENNVEYLSLTNSSANHWDNGYEGNYWSNYNGTDTSIPADGIGDTFLPWEGVDNYPLMNRYWNPADINHDLKIDISDLARTSGAFGSYPGHPKWNPHCDITGLEYLVPDGKVDIIDVAVVSANFGKYYGQ